MKVLFLDIDGVLNDHARNAAGVCGFKPECVENLNAVLQAHPDLKIIVSSAWRYLVSQQAMTLKGLEHLLRIGGLACENRVIGITPSDEEINSRGKQIACAMRGMKPSRYLVLDDMPWNFDACGLKFYLTQPDKGLSRLLADQIIAHFAKL